MKYRVLIWKEWDPENSRGDIWVDFSKSDTPELRNKMSVWLGIPLIFLTAQLCMQDHLFHICQTPLISHVRCSSRQNPPQPYEQARKLPVICELLFKAICHRTGHQTSQHVRAHHFREGRNWAWMLVPMPSSHVGDNLVPTPL